MTEREKMLSGLVYKAHDPGILRDLTANKDRVWAYNNLRPSDTEGRRRLLKEMLGRCDDDTMINPPFYCDYGRHILVGHHFFANFNLTVLDEACVTFGDNCFIGPNVSIYTACHPTDPVSRNAQQQWAKPVKVGSNVWIGGSVTILAGVTIGDNVTIGAGSVVTRDIEANTIAVGNPARVIRRLDL